MSHTVTIDFAEDGTPTIKVNGVAGKSCTDLTKKVEEAFGSKKETKLTGEYNQKATQGATAGQR